MGDEQANEDLDDTDQNDTEGNVAFRSAPAGQEGEDDTEGNRVLRSAPAGQEGEDDAGGNRFS